jgi:hypothetical protein
MVFGSEDHNKIGLVDQNNTKTSINNLNKLIILTFGDIYHKLNILTQNQYLTSMALKAVSL